MTTTMISSASKEVKIGFDEPFVIIGERIKPTGRKILAEEMKVGDYSRVEADALAQVEAGAHMLDVNAGIPLADEPAILAEAIQLVQSITDTPISIDSSIEMGVSVIDWTLPFLSTRPLSRRWRQDLQFTRARRWSTLLLAKTKCLNVCYLWWPNTAPP